MVLGWGSGWRAGFVGWWDRRAGEAAAVGKREGIRGKGEASEEIMAGEVVSDDHDAGVRLEEWCINYYYFLGRM